MGDRKTAAQIMEKKAAIKAELDRRMPKIQADAIWEKSTEKLASIMERYADLPRGMRPHTAMPDPVPKVSTKIEYWYGEEERRARKNNLAYAMRAYPQTVPREFKDLAHAELVMMFPKRFY